MFEKREENKRDEQGEEDTTKQEDVGEKGHIDEQKRKERKGEKTR